jgi:hypothetical protein
MGLKEDIEKLETAMFVLWMKDFFTAEDWVKKSEYDSRIKDLKLELAQTENPCYNCGNRYVTKEHNCHSYCEFYAVWQEHHQRRANRERQQKEDAAFKRKVGKR